MFCQCFWYKMCFRFAKITISVLHNYKSNPLSADAFYHLKMHQNSSADWALPRTPLEGAYSAPQTHSDYMDLRGPLRGGREERSKRKEERVRHCGTRCRSLFVTHL